MKDSTGDPQGKDESQKDVRSTDPAKGTPGAASRKPFGIVTCILLGLFVLLTVMFVVELLKFRQISGEIKDVKDDMTEKLARMKDDAARPSESLRQFV